MEGATKHSTAQVRIMYTTLVIKEDHSRSQTASKVVKNMGKAF